MDCDGACLIHLTTVMVNNFKKSLGVPVGFLSPMHKKDLRLLFKKGKEM